METYLNYLTAALAALAIFLLLSIQHTLRSRVREPERSADPTRPKVERHTGPDGTVWFSKDGIRHRVGGPAVVYAGGDLEYCYEGQNHNFHGPAISHTDGTKFWMQFGQLHNEHGPAVVRPNGDKEYYQYGMLHNPNGPAIEVPFAQIHEFFLYGIRFPDGLPLDAENEREKYEENSYTDDQDEYVTRLAEFRKATKRFIARRNEIMGIQE